MALEPYHSSELPVLTLHAWDSFTICSEQKPQSITVAEGKGSIISHYSINELPLLTAALHPT